MLTRSSKLTSRFWAAAGRRHFASRTPVKAQLNSAHAHEATVQGATRYVPSGSDGRFLIDQLNAHWRSAVAARDFKKDEVIGTAPGTLHSEPTRFTVQLTPEKHLEFSGGLEFVNHGCEPSTRVVVSENSAEVAFVATRSIAEGEHLSFDYTTSEWDMDEKFDCRCGAPSCRGHIGGAKYLSKKEVAARLPLFTPSILRQLLTRQLAN